MKGFFTEIKVRFGDVDAAGIAYFPRIHGYLHEVFEELWERHVGIRYVDLISGRRLGFPLVHSRVDFRAPLRFGDAPSVHVTCTRLGNSSVELRYKIFNGPMLCVDARQTTATVELDTLKPVPLPEEFRARFAALVEDAAP